LQQTLQRLGYQVVCTGSGQEAFALLRDLPFDVVLLDLIMPDMSGTTVLRRIKLDPDLHDTRVIMVSASDGVDSVARCIEQGAEDYLVKPIHPVLLQARIDDCIERRRLHESERQTMKALVESQANLAGELGEAAAYVKSLLPPPLDGPVSARWEFIPSRQLGGDALGYAWIDPDHFAFYLLDVSGHGIRAALLSITVMNLLRAGALRDANYLDPAHMLTALNGVFQMQDHNNMYFSIWYGVFHRPSRTLQYANAGHPPAILIRECHGATPALERLDAHGPIIGALPHRVYDKTALHLPIGSRLFLFSDGVYESRRPNGTYGQFEDFFSLMARQNPHTLDFEHLLSLTQEIRCSDHFPDDYSLVGFRFRS
jgi:phosphoserine phosphatase RsbU/P